MPICLRTRECLVCQRVPSTSISERCETHTFDNSSTVFKFLFLKWWLSRHGVSQFAISFHAFLRMTFHVIRPSNRITCDFFPLSIFQLPQQRFVIRTSFCFHQYVRSICIHVECIPSTRGQEMMSVLSDLPISSVASTWSGGFAIFQPFFCRPRVQTRIDRAFDVQKGIPNSVLSPILVPSRTSSNCLSHNNQANV